jgi:hypothetical protein
MEYQVYISHFIDKDKVDKEFEAWVKNFRLFLEMALKRISGLKVNIITSNDVISPKFSFNKSIEESDCYIMIFSQKHIHSIQANNELQIILNHCKKKGYKEYPVFKVFKNPISNEHIPDKIADKIDYPLYRIDPETNDIIEFNKLEGSEEENPFWFKITDLTYDIISLLKGETKQHKHSLTVYLAEVSKDQRYNRDLIKRDLLLKGHKVLPLKKIPLNDINQVEEMILSYLASCDFSIHIFGDEKGDVIENTDFSTVDFQNTIASKYNETYKKDHEEKNFFRLIWISPDLKLYDDKQLLKIEKLKRNVKELENTEIIETPLETFRSIIKNRAETKNKEHENLKIRKNTNGKTNKIYFIFENKENEQIGNIIRFLEGKGFEVLTPGFKKEQKELISKHKENLVESNGILIFYEMNKEWLNAKLKDIKKSPGYGKKNTYNAKAVLCLQDQKPDKEQLNSNDLITINFNKEMALEESLRPFLNEMQ